MLGNRGMVVISVHRVLQVVRDFEASGGASLGLVAWELALEEDDVVPAWDRATALGLLERAATDPVHREELWRLSTLGWAELGVGPDDDRRRVTVVNQLGILDRIGDPGLEAITRIGSFLTDGSATAVHIFDERYQRRVAAVNAPLEAHPAHDAMCMLVVDTGEAIVCDDAVADPRFSYTSFIKGDEPVRFYASVPLRTSADGTVVGSLCAFDTVTRSLSEDQLSLFEDLARQAITHIEYARLAIDLGHLATHDPLTGVANRLLLPDRLEQALARLERFGGEVLLVLLDVEDFSRMRVERGHEVCDAMLIDVARRLGEVVSAGDTVARLDDDEFALVVELADGAIASDVIDRIRAAVAPPVAFDGEQLPLALGLGFATAAAREDAGAVLARARAALSADG